MVNVNSDNRNILDNARQDKKPIRVFLSGLGLIGVQHARLVDESEDCELAAIVVPI